jgi:Holliday junction resolvasome RuvABC endonuclease subunit
MACLMQFCEKHNIDYCGVMVGTIKKYFTGRGNASKSDMINHARTLGFQVKNDNEADALALLCYALAEANDGI